MTAAPTTKVPLSPLALIMVTLAAASTASATIGFWAAGKHYRANPPRRARRRNGGLDELEAGFAALDAKELDKLERRLRETDR